MAYNYMMRPHVIPPTPERFCVKGRRTRLSTGYMRYTRCTFEVVDGENGKILVMVSGGITGYEAAYITKEDGSLTNFMTNRDGWTANLGTPGRYDELVIDRDEMNAVRDWVRKRI